MANQVNDHRSTLGLIQGNDTSDCSKELGQGMFRLGEYS